MLSSLLAGLGLGLSLIVAIGAQNLFVLRQGIRRQHAVAVALVCALSDAALIALGVSGLGALLHAVPWHELPALTGRPLVVASSVRQWCRAVAGAA